ncbi:MAG: hypothetical protein AAFV90_08025 [Cyanobacteria bacterium J06634_5]
MPKNEKSSFAIDTPLEEQDAATHQTSRSGHGPPFKQLLIWGGLAIAAIAVFVSWTKVNGRLGPFTSPSLKNTARSPQPTEELGSEASPFSPKDSRISEVEAPLTSEIQAEPISIPSDSEGVLVTNTVNPGTTRRYLVDGKAEQILKVQMTEASQGPVSFNVLKPSGEIITDVEGVVYWESFLPIGGDYSIDVKATQPSEFTLEIQLIEPVSIEVTPPSEASKLSTTEKPAGFSVEDAAVDNAATENVATENTATENTAK